MSPARKTPPQGDPPAPPRAPRRRAAPGGRAAPAPGTRPVRAARRDKERAILREAEAQFARYGFEGASLEGIAAAVGLNRQHLLYYFASKDALYRQVLDDVMAQWLAGLGALAEADEPAPALRAYIAAKLRSARERPDASRVFAKEVIAGVPRYADALREQVLPVLRDDLRHFQRWAREGRIAGWPAGERAQRSEFTHLVFLLWAMTQAYADLAPQFALLLGKPALESADYAAAQRVIERLVLAALGTPTPPTSDAPTAPPMPRAAATTGTAPAQAPRARARPAPRAARKTDKKSP